MLAMELALSSGDARSAHLAGLVLVSATPRFRVWPDWPHGCSDAVFGEFERSLEEDQARLLGRFFALMLHGDDISRSDYNAIAKASLDRKHPPSQRGLKNGLSLLNQLDLRSRLADISLPVLVVHGQGDAVTPVEAGRYLARHIPKADLRVMPCGHAPHLTQTTTFNKQLEDWCLNITSTRTG
jgi:pimeloyl-[acyl-carrier protein] methyl ester esterase